MAFVSMLSVGMLSCSKDDGGIIHRGNGSNIPRRYTLTVLPNNADWGTTIGSGTYNSSGRAYVEAVPATGYYFIKWGDGVVSNPRTVTVNHNMTLYALFSSTPNDPNPYNPMPAPGPTPPTPSSEWIDLGLPSGLLWYSCNLGSNAPEEYGNYYAWGETVPKEAYDWSTYRYCTVDSEGYLQTLTKYNIASNYGTIDNLTTLQAMDDAATAALGNGVRTPTKAEWEELVNNTTVEWTTLNGINGRKFTGSNGNTLFLPAAGHRTGLEFIGAGSVGNYWSSSLFTDFSGGAWSFDFNSDGQRMNYYYRNVGFPVRAVRQN